MSKLFDQMQLGRHNLKNRMIMAPMTRSRADHSGVPGDLVSTYYGQRASAGLIITEGVFPSDMGKGYVRTPGIVTEEQTKAWRQVTDTIHQQGGRVFMQIMHCGRISHPSLLPHNALPVAPSPVKAEGKVWTDAGPLDFVMPRELATEEIGQLIKQYGDATRRALDAGFDGVELHAASGYLPEQFVSSKTNHRSDQYGGSIENRARFVLEVLDEMIAVAGSDRVGVKISPEMNFNDIHDDTPQDTYLYLVDQFEAKKLAYLHVALFGTQTDYHGMFRPRFSGTYLVGGGFDKQKAEDFLNEGKADAVVFGSLFLANPDLVERFRIDAPLNTPDRDKFYSQGLEGYTDYPSLNHR